IPARRDHLLYLGAPAFRPRHLGTLPAPAIQLEGDGTAATGARAECAAARRRPCHRRAARPSAVRARETLSAGAVRFLDRESDEGVADIGGAGDRLGAWLHRVVFLAAHEGVVQARR